MTSQDEYMHTINRLEPEIHSIDPGAFYASAAISLKRIADALEASNAFKFAEMPNLLDIQGEQELDAVEEDKSSTPITQNFDVTDEDPYSLTTGYYIAKFIVTEIVYLFQKEGERYVLRFGEERRRALAEFRFIQKVMFQNRAIIKDSRI